MWTQILIILNKAIALYEKNKTCQRANDRRWQCVPTLNKVLGRPNLEYLSLAALLEMIVEASCEEYTLLSPRKTPKAFSQNNENIRTESVRPTDEKKKYREIGTGLHSRFGAYWCQIGVVMPALFWGPLKIFVKTIIFNLDHKPRRGLQWSSLHRDEKNPTFVVQLLTFGQVCDREFENGDQIVPSGCPEGTFKSCNGLPPIGVLHARLETGMPCLLSHPITSPDHDKRVTYSCQKNA